jgi:hypothetical protein
MNKEADEICNAVLDDDREWNTSVISPRSQPTTTEQTLQSILKLLQQQRRPTIRTLPAVLRNEWSAFVTLLLMRYKEDPDKTRMMFLIAPHLITLNRKPWIGCRDDFAFTRTHLIALRTPEYLDDTIHTLLETLQKQEKPTKTQKGSGLNKSQITAYVKAGLFSKIWETNDQYDIAKPTLENVELIRKGFPQADLPPELPVHPTHTVSLKYLDIRCMVRKLKKGKAVGLSGWCRELLEPVISAVTPTERREEIVARSTPKSPLPFFFFF